MFRLAAAGAFKRQTMSCSEATKPPGAPRPPAVPRGGARHDAGDIEPPTRPPEEGARALGTRERPTPGGGAWTLRSSRAVPRRARGRLGERLGDERPAAGRPPKGRRARRRGRDSDRASAPENRRLSRGFGTQSARAGRSLGNDPSAGSPTETLLRLHLPLNDKV